MNPRRLCTHARGPEHTFNFPGSDSLVSFDFSKQSTAPGMLATAVSMCPTEAGGEPVSGPPPFPWAWPGGWVVAQVSLSHEGRALCLGINLTCGCSGALQRGPPVRGCVFMQTRHVEAGELIG